MLKDISDKFDVKESIAMAVIQDKKCLVLSSRINGRWSEREIIGFIGKHYLALNSSHDWNVLYSNNMPICFASPEDCEAYCTEVNWRIPHVHPFPVSSNIYLNKVLYVTRATQKHIVDYLADMIDKFNQLDQTDENNDMKHELEMLLNHIDDSSFDNDGNPIIGKESYSWLIRRIQVRYLDSRAEELLAEYKTNQANAGRLTIK